MVALALSGQPRAIFTTYFRAYTWHVKNYKATLARRKKIQRIRTVSDADVIKKMHIFPHKFFALLELGIPKINR